MPDLVKTTTVLEMVECQLDGLPKFAVVPDAPRVRPERQTVVELDRNVWVDLGRPTTVTVTIEPGDKLNEPCNIPIPTYENPDLGVTA